MFSCQATCVSAASELASSEQLLHMAILGQNPYVFESCLVKALLDCPSKFFFLDQVRSSGLC